VPAPPFSLPPSRHDTGPRPLPGLGLVAPARPDPIARRDRIWDLSPNLHCSIIGTCLSTAALRQLFAKLNQSDAKTLSDHGLHSRAVKIAGQRDVAGKLLNKMLDKRHEGHIKRFAKAKTPEEVRTLWLAALERGDIPGAYWAALSHPATDQAVVSEVFGEVHMLSHLVGTANRADIVRLRQLEGELGERDEKLARQEARLQRMARQREELTQQIEELEQELRGRPTLVQMAGVETPAAPALKQRLADERARSNALAARVAELETSLAAKEQDLRQFEEKISAQRNEQSSLEATLTGLMGAKQETTSSAPDLTGQRLLYVGGRPKQLEQLRSLASRLGGTLLTHDGGIEESTALLPGLVSQSDMAFFPVDCVSHGAAGQVKRLCREAGKPFVPLRSASLASFIAAIGRLHQAGEASLGQSSLGRHGAASAS